MERSNIIILGIDKDEEGEDGEGWSWQRDAVASGYGEHCPVHGRLQHPIWNQQAPSHFVVIPFPTSKRGAALQPSALCHREGARQGCLLWHCDIVTLSWQHNMLHCDGPSLHNIIRST